MERLTFDNNGLYSAFEGAVHVSRYLFAKPFCSGKKVLDIACGEGYGSALLAKWGAESVLGVDIAPAAIDAAKSNFSGPAVSFVQGDIVQSEILDGETDFDLIVSLETIEHVDDPEKFLLTLKKHLKPDGVIIVSCPNDHWYYKDGGDNPYHMRRYTFQEFKDFSEKILGPAGAWSLGGFAVGFASTPFSAPRPATAKTQALMMSAEEINSALCLPMDDKVALTETNASYYVGIWGPLAHAPAIYCGYPVTMDLAGPLLWPEMTLLRNRVFEAESLEDQRRVALELAASETAMWKARCGQYEQAAKNWQASSEHHEQLSDIRGKSAAELEAIAEQLRIALEQTSSALEARQSSFQKLEDKTQTLMLDLRQATMRNTVLTSERERLATLLADVKNWARELEAHNAGLRDELSHSRERIGHADNEIARLRDWIKPKGFRAWRKTHLPHFSDLGKLLSGAGAKK